MKKHFSRRNFLKSGAVAVGALATTGVLGRIESALAASQGEVMPQAETGARVFFTKDLSAEGLQKMYVQVAQNLTGKVVVKVHTGELGGPNIIPRDWVKALLPSVPNAAIVECNVFYGGPRGTTAGHRKVLETNGWTFAPVDIMDADGDVSLPVKGGKWFKEVAFGRNIVNYDSMLVLTHFKGHTMGGFGGSLKNISIGCASGKGGKKQLHSDGSSSWGATGVRLMEHMAEGGKAVTDYFGSRIVYINVLRNMSVDCDCDSSPARVVTPDIGILASTDILAVEQASVDMIYALPKEQRRHMVERIESRSGLRQLTSMKELGMGTDQYEIVNV